jgi:AAA15 family ATPase/GTPase
MLVFFAVANFLSIRERVELSFVPSAFYKERADCLIRCDAVPGGKLLPTALVYGPNASGKTNLIASLRFFQGAILRSHDQGPEDDVPVRPFALSQECEKLPTTVEMEFILEGIRYHYGFRATKRAFVAEWLNYYPKGRRQVLFEREGQSVKFGRALKGQNRVIADLMRSNSLFLSVAAQNDHDQLSKIHRYLTTFETKPDRKPTVVMSDDEELDPRIIGFLEQIGTGVMGFRRREAENDDKSAAFAKNMRVMIAEFIGMKVEEVPQFDEKYVLELAHRGEDGKPVYLSLKHESSGTRRLLGLLASAFAALDKSGLIIIDELEESLHTQVADAMLGLFCSRASNKGGAQLLATTHDTNLMGSRYLRRDQIWFTEKDGTGSTHLFPLSDIRTRNTDNIQKGYLQGRYGAIPFSGDFSNLIADDE